MPLTTIPISGLESNVVQQIQSGGGIPKISSISYPGDDTAALPAGGQTITINGSNFSLTSAVYIDGTQVGVVSYVNANTLTFVAPAKAASNYSLYVVNPDGATAIAVPGISFSNAPVWSTSSGSIGTPYEAASFSVNLSATGDGSVTYAMAAGNTLPTGLTLAANGLLSGTVPATDPSTTYTFHVNATDSQNQDTSRSFSVTYTKDEVTWSSPANGAAYSLNTGQANTISLEANSAAGKSISYTVQSGSLPANVSISGANVTGTPNSVQANTSVVIRATANGTNRFADRTLYFATAVSTITINFLVVAGGGGAGSGFALSGSPGGGAGGFRTSAGTSGGGAGAENALELSPNVAYSLTIGAGGAGALQNGTYAVTNGSNTTFSSITSIGGGRSAHWGVGVGKIPGSNGGSGGGGYGSESSEIAGSGTANQGYSGGSTNIGNGFATAGGGGAGGAGGNATSSSGQPGGNGGVGVDSNITGSTIGYAGGGGGSSYYGSAGTASHGGGEGGRGSFTNSTSSGKNGTANRGGGGGGGSGGEDPWYKGGNGGSGVVVIKIPDSKSASFTAGVSQTMSQSGGFKIYTVTAAGINDTVTFS